MSVTHPIENKDFRAVALTCVVMKCFKKIILNMIKPKISSSLDPHQFVNREGCSAKDAMINIIHLIKEAFRRSKSL